MIRKGTLRVLLLVAMIALFAVLVVTGEDEERSRDDGDELVDTPVAGTRSAETELARTQPAVDVQPVAATPAARVGVYPVQDSIYDVYRLERERVRSRRTEVVESILNDPGASEERRLEAQSLLLDLLGRQAKEVELEHLLLARGYEDAIVVLDSQAANVVLAGLLEREEAGRIGELVARVGGVNRERIAIVDGRTP